MTNLLHKVLLTFVVLATPGFARGGAISPDQARQLHERVSPSMVAVQWTWEYEFGRMEFVGPGVVVREDGLIAMPLQVADPGVPDVQMTDFKIIVPGQDNQDDQEIDAIFQGRDERVNLAFVRPAETSAHKWAPIRFEDIPVLIAEPIMSIGMLPKSAGYRTFLASGAVAGRLRGEVPTVLVTGGGLAAIGAPVFNADGKAIGFVNAQVGSTALLHATGGNQARQFQNPASSLLSVRLSPVLFTPAGDLLQGLNDPPTPGQTLAYPWVGASLTGLEKDVAEVFGLQDQPAVEVSDVVAGAPADRAGLKVGMKIVKLNGEPLERGDDPQEIPQILIRKIQRMKVGSTITLSILNEKDKPLEEIKMTLEKRPLRQNELPRFWAEDLGFSTRDITFHDAYTRKQPPEMKGVVVSLVKPQSAAASARLDNEDIIQSINAIQVENREQFKAEYEKLRKSQPGEAVVFVIMKPDTSTQTIRIEPPR